MLTALIVDDELPARQIIRAYIESFGNIKVIGECDNGFEALKELQQLKPDILFLDIQMPKVTGLELLEVLDNPPHVIFTTAYDQYALKAFELNAVDYLLKPFSQERFNAALKKVVAQCNVGERINKSTLEDVKQQINTKVDRIVVKRGSKLEVIALNDILYFEAQDDYVMIYTNSGRYLKSKTMKYYEQHLPIKEFVRIHRSYIVNVNHIQRLEPYDKETYLAIISDNQKLKISRSGYKKLKALLNF